MQDRYELQVLDIRPERREQRVRRLLYAQQAEGEHVLPADELADLRHRIHGPAWSDGKKTENAKWRSSTTAC